MNNNYIGEVSSINEYDIMRFTKEEGIYDSYIYTHRIRLARLCNDINILLKDSSYISLLDVAGTEQTKKIICNFCNIERYDLVAGIDIEDMLWYYIYEDKYDIVICTEVIEHMKHDPGKLIWQMNLCLHKNGVLILTTVNVARHISLFEIAHGHTPYVFGYFFPGRDDRHHREFAPIEIAELIASNGFTALYYTFDCFDKSDEQKQMLSWCSDHIPDYQHLIHRDDIVVLAKKIYSPLIPIRIFPIYYINSCTIKMTDFVFPESRVKLIDNDYDYNMLSV